MKLAIFMDNLTSWYYPYAKTLFWSLQEAGHEVRFASRLDQIEIGDCLFLLSVEQIVPAGVLARNKHNLVVHSAPLPKGRGWAPITWQVLEGKNSITNTLFEAVEKADAGPVYLTNTIELDGSELLLEIHEKQGTAVNALVLEFVRLHSLGWIERGLSQKGDPTYYRKRTPSDSELDFSKTIAEQFNLLRVVDNEKYPAFFMRDGVKYVLTIRKG